MTDWYDAATEYAKTGKVVKCPFCGSENVRVEAYRSSVRDSISLLCLNCNRGDHFDGCTTSRLSDERITHYI